MQEVRVITTQEGARIISVPGAEGPRTHSELTALHLQREELQQQIAGLRRRRNELDEQRHVTSGPQRAATEARIAEVDARKAALEARLDQVNDRIANAHPSALVVTTEPPMNLGHQVAANLVPLAGMLSTFVLLPLAIAFARLLWKRGTAAANRPALNETAIVTRLEQLQTSVDTMAVEIERISEGQRYVSRIMGEKEKVALPR